MMVVRIYFAAHSETFASYSEWVTSDAVGSAVLAELFRRFPDTLQNIGGTGDRVELRTRTTMPADWADGSAKK